MPNRPSTTVPTDNADLDPDLPDDTLTVISASSTGSTGSSTPADATGTGDSSTNLGADNMIDGVFGVLTINTIGSYSYNLTDNNADILGLTEGQTATDQFTYTITDEGGKTSTTTLTITIEGNNDGPTAVADTNYVQAGMFAYTDGEGVHDDMLPAAITGNVLQTIPHNTNAQSTLDDSATDNADLDPDLPDDTLTVISASSTGSTGSSTPADATGTGDSSTNLGADNMIDGVFGVLTINTIGSYSYNLTDNNADILGLTEGQTATDQFTYTITDEGGKTSTTTLTITIEGNNDGPTAVADTNYVQAGMFAYTDGEGAHDDMLPAAITGQCAADDPA